MSRLSARVDEEGRAAYEARFAGELSLEEVGGMIRAEPRGVALLAYQRRLALEQRQAEEQRALRRRYAEAAGK